MIVRGFAAPLAVVLLALLAAACDGGGGGGSTPQADETVAEGETPAADGATAGGELGDLEALASEAAGEVTAKVTYQFTSEEGGEVIEGEWVLVQRPPDSRFEFTSTEGGEEFRTIIISAGGETYVCSSSGEGTCLATDIGEATAQATALAPIFDVPRDLAEEAGDVDIVDKSQRSIAGLDATCFTVRSEISGLGEGEVCFSEEGLLLLLRGETDGDSFTFEATSVSTDVTDADFEPPFRVIDLGELGELELVPTAIGGLGRGSCRGARPQPPAICWRTSAIVTTRPV